MQFIGQVVRILRISDGQKPQMGPIPAIPFLIEVQTSGGQGLVEISQDAALELVIELSKHLRVRGSL
jgi:hypothetical protein